MPLDIRVLRADPEKVKLSQRRRFKPDNIVDAVLAKDDEWKRVLKDLDNTNKEINKINKQIKHLYKTKNKKTGTDNKQILRYMIIAIGVVLMGSVIYRFDNWLWKSMMTVLVLAMMCIGYQFCDYCDKMNVLKRQKLKFEDMQLILKGLEKETKDERDALLNTIGNIVDDTVPVPIDERNEDEIISLSGIKPKITNPKRHDELLWMIGGYERKHGAECAGNKGFFLKGYAVLLNMALQRYGIDFLLDRKFTPIYPPFFMNKDMMAKTAQLEDYDETLYHVTGESNDKQKYLIATSEQPLSALHYKERLQAHQLPIRYAGISTCFRKEAGAGKDFCGIFRVHQFEKIEQFIYCAPTKSWQMLDEIVQNAEQFYQSLAIPYRIVNILSNDLNNAAAKKYDLEGWFPATQRYRELVSASNCTDYQAIAMETKYGLDGKQYVHMLNATLTATTRTICAILENYQTEDGIVVPEVLRKYMGGIDKIPFINPCFDTKH